MGMGDNTGLFQTPLWLTGNSYLTSPATAQQAALQAGTPSVIQCVTPRGWGNWELSSLQSYCPALASTVMGLL